MSHDVESGLEEFFKNILAIASIVIAVFLIFIAPLALIGAIIITTSIEDPVEKQYYKYQAWLFGTLCVILWDLIVYQVMPGWWIIKHWPTFWGMFYNETRAEAVFSDGLTCIPLLWVFSKCSAHYGSVNYTTNQYYPPKWYVDQQNREASAESDAQYADYVAKRGPYKPFHQETIVATVAKEPD